MNAVNAGALLLVCVASVGLSCLLALRFSGMTEAAW